jgi:hypothetical protein
MSSARESFRQPPLVLCDGRLLLYADGEFMAFMLDGKSWTSGVLDGRDVAALTAYLPIVRDNTMDVYDQEVTE